MDKKSRESSVIRISVDVDLEHWKRVRDIAIVLFGYPLYVVMHHGIRWYKKGDTFYKNVAEPFLIKLILRTIGLCVLLVVLAVLVLGIWAHYTEGVQ